MKAFGWQSINVVCQSIIQLIFNSIMARLLMPESFGIMAMVIVVTGFLDVFAQVGIGPAIIQRKEITENQISSSFVLSIFLGLLFFGLLWFTAPFASNYYNEPQLIEILRVIGLSFIIAAIGIIPKSLLLRKLQFKQLFISVAIGMIIGLMIVGLTMANKDFEIWALVAAMLTQNAVMTICYWYYHPIKLNKKVTIKHATPLIKYGGGTTLFTLFNYLSSKIDILIISNYNLTGQKTDSLGENWESTGIYDQALKIMSYPITIIGKLSDSVMFSGLSMIQDQKMKLKQAFKSAFTVLSLISLPASVFLVIYSKEVVLLMLGNQYYQAIPVVQILFIGLFLRTVIKLCDAIVRALDRVYTGALIKFIYFLAVGIFVYIMSSDVSKDWGIHNGLSGVAFALLAAISIQFILMFFTSLRILELNFSSIVKLVVGPAVVALIAVVFCIAMHNFTAPFLTSDTFFVQLISLMLGALALGLAYLVVIWFFPVLFGKDEHNMLVSLFRKLPQRGIISTLLKRIERLTSKKD